MEVASMPNEWHPEYVRPRPSVQPVLDRSSLQVLLDQITCGHYDDDLEAILAAAHGRKRAKRGVRNPRGLGRV